MAYVHSRYEVEIIPALGATGVAAATQQNGLNLTATLIAGVWGPGLVPHIIRGAALVRVGAEENTTFSGDPVGVRFTADISTPGTATHLFTISLPTAVAGYTSVYHKPTYIIELMPGMLLRVNASTAATAGVFAKGILYVEPRWEEPVNITGMRKAT